MPEKESTPNTHSSSSNVDLNSLADLSFGPSWADNNNAKHNTERDYKKSSKIRVRNNSRIIKKDRRGQPKHNSNRTDSIGNKEFIPKFDIKIYPQAETFERLIKQLKGNFITYQLFEITRLILEKSDRFVCLISRKNNNDKNVLEPIYFTPEDNMPFETENEAINHYCENFLDKIFDIKIVKVDPPKGKFTLVYRCPFTKHLIGPPNFHRFSELLKEHHNSKIKNLSIEEYQNRLESVSDENSINEWLESSTEEKHYCINDGNNNEEPNIIFKTTEEARRFLLANHKEKVVKTSENFRFSGSKLRDLSKSNLKSSILQAVEAQKRFPLDTANNIRGRLRRHKFTIYKKGSKGISYVCCVKRKFRDETTVFTDSISNLISFIEKNENIIIQNLPYKYLSIPKPATENESMQNISDNYTDSETDKIKEVIRSVRWLISEGYVTEYCDGKIIVHPKMEINNSINNEEENGTGKSEKPFDDTPVATKQNNILEEKVTKAFKPEDTSSINCNTTKEVINDGKGEKNTNEAAME